MLLWKFSEALQCHMTCCHLSPERLEACTDICVQAGCSAVGFVQSTRVLLNLLSLKVLHTLKKLIYLLLQPALEFSFRPKCLYLNHEAVQDL